MQTYFTSDLHISHKNIPKYREQVTSAEHNTELMLHKMSLLGKRDVLWVLGDFIFDSPDYNYVVSQIKSMPFQLRIVMGNHDSKLLYHSFQSAIQLPLISYKNMWLSHCPIHPQELRNRTGCIHGHLHQSRVLKIPRDIDTLTANVKYQFTPGTYQSIEDPQYFNVNIDVNNYEFVPIEHIKQHFKDNT